MSASVYLSVVDLILIFLYFGSVLFVGFRAAKRTRSEIDDYLLAGRTLTLPMFVATLVSTWYGGILGVGEFSYRYGISNWFVLGFPYYIFAVLFALLLAKRIRSTNFVTIPDKLESSYDRRTAILGGVLTFFLVTPAPYVLMLGVLVHVILRVDFIAGILLSTVIASVYLVQGGFRSGVWANALQFVMMFLGFALIIPFAYAQFGSLDFIRENVPPLHLTLHGGNSWQYILAWFFIALWTLVDPSFHQRCYAAKDGTTAQRGILLSVLFWFVFDAMTSTAGLYARAASPDLPEPMYAYPMLAELVMPPVAKGLFYVGMLATIMSTLSSLLFISASTVGKDIAGRLVHSNPAAGGDADATVSRWTKIGMLIGGVFSIALALVVPSVVNIWYTIGTCIIPGLLVPVVASYFDSLRMPPRFAFLAMLFGWMISTSSLVWGKLFDANGVPQYWFGLEPMYPGLIAAVAIWAMGKVKARNLK
jgi:SSS family solute:Na+ symporter